MGDGPGPRRTRPDAGLAGVLWSGRGATASPGEATSENLAEKVLADGLRGVGARVSSSDGNHRAGTTMTTTFRAAPMRQTVRDLQEVTRVRHAIVDELHGRGFDGEADDAGVMVSELLANVFEHARSEAQVWVEIEGDRVRVSVHDESEAVPKVQPIDPRRVGGNGMRVVDAFAEAWGVDPDPTGKTVWFTVQRARS